MQFCSTPDIVVIHFIFSKKLVTRNRAINTVSGAIYGKTLNLTSQKYSCLVL
jgi:hypothetical protein